MLVRTASDRPPYFAVGFKSEKSDGTFRYVWLFKVRAKPVLQRPTPQGRHQRHAPDRREVEWTAIKRTHDGRYQAVADEGQTASTLRRPRPFWSPSTSRDFHGGRVRSVTNRTCMGAHRLPVHSRRRCVSV